MFSVKVLDLVPGAFCRTACDLLYVRLSQDLATGSFHCRYDIGIPIQLLPDGLLHQELLIDETIKDLLLRLLNPVLGKLPQPLHSLIDLVNCDLIAVYFGRDLATFLVAVPATAGRDYQAGGY